MPARRSSWALPRARAVRDAMQATANAGDRLGTPRGSTSGCASDAPLHPLASICGCVQSATTLCWLAAQDLLALGRVRRVTEDEQRAPNLGSHPLGHRWALGCLQLVPLSAQGGQPPHLVRCWTQTSWLTRRRSLLRQRLWSRQHLLLHRSKPSIGLASPVLDCTRSSSIVAVLLSASA